MDQKGSRESGIIEVSGVLAHFGHRSIPWIRLGAPVPSLKPRHQKGAAEAEHKRGREAALVKISEGHGLANTMDVMEVEKERKFSWA